MMSSTASPVVRSATAADNAAVSFPDVAAARNGVEELTDARAAGLTLTEREDPKPTPTPSSGTSLTAASFGCPADDASTRPVKPCPASAATLLADKPTPLAPASAPAAASTAPGSIMGSLTGAAFAMSTPDATTIAAAPGARNEGRREGGPRRTNGFIPGKPLGTIGRPGTATPITPPAPAPLTKAP